MHRGASSRPPSPPGSETFPSAVSPASVTREHRLDSSRAVGLSCRLPHSFSILVPLFLLSINPCPRALSECPSWLSTSIPVPSWPPGSPPRTPLANGTVKTSTPEAWGRDCFGPDPAAAGLTRVMLHREEERCPGKPRRVGPAPRWQAVARPRDACDQRPAVCNEQPAGPNQARVC